MFKTRSKRRNSMRPIQNSTTRREFFRNAAIGAAGIGIMNSPAIAVQKPKGGLPAVGQAPRGVLPDVEDGSKHGHLIKKFSLPAKPNYDHPKMPGNNDAIAWPRGKDLEGADINFSWGFYSKIGDWHPYQTGGHVHPNSDELLIYAGLDPNNPEYLGAEIEHDCGKEYEKHVFRVPTVFCVPRNVVHCPQITLKTDKSYGLTDKSFGFIVCSLEAAHSENALPKRSPLDTTDGHKYDHLYKKLVFRKDVKAKTGPGNADALAWLKGKDLENFNANFAWGFYSSVGDWGAKPHTHVGDQFLAFVGLDGERPNYLGAEIEISLGEEQEKHVIDVPSLVICRAGFTHGPIVTKKVDRPFGFYSIRQDKGDASEINPA
jgi:hypothetical protein